MPGEGGPKNGTAAALLILWMTAAYNQLTVNLEGPTQQWMSRHYPSYRSLEVFQEPQEPRRCSEELLGELWLDVANSTTARYRCPSVVSLMSFSTREAVYFKFAAMRAPRLRINLLHSLHTILQYVHLPRQGAIGLDRSLQCLDRTNSRISRDRHQRDSYGPLAFLRSHGHHRAHASPTPRTARRASNRSIEFFLSPAFDRISRTLAVLTLYHSSNPSYSGRPDTLRKLVGTTLLQLPAQRGQLAHTLVVEILRISNVVPFRHTEHAKTFLRGLRGFGLFTPATLHQKIFGLFRALRELLNSAGGVDTAVPPTMGAHCRTSTHPTAAARSLLGQ